MVGIRPIIGVMAKLAVRANSAMDRLIESFTRIRSEARGRMSEEEFRRAEEEFERIVAKVRARRPKTSAALRG
jgi:hypothetical protein